MASREIRLEVALDETDVVRASWELLLRRAGALLVIWCVLAGVVAYLSLQSFAPIDWRTLIATTALVVGPPTILIVLVAWNARRQFRQARDDLRPIHYCIHDDGMDIASVKRSGWIPWEGFRDAIEIPSAFLVFLEKDQHYLLPKRCFTGSDDVDELRKLLAEVMPPKA